MSTNNFNSIRLLPNYDITTLNRKVASKGEVFFDPSTVSIRVFDGFVTGGHQILRADLSNLETTIPSSALTGNIPNSKLANSTVTIGSNTISLGGSLTSLSGLSSISATTISGTFTGNITGNVTGNVTGGTSGTHTGPVVGNVQGNVTGNVTGSLTGNADTATKLATARTINNQLFDGTANIEINSNAQGLTGTFIASNVVGSSLTSVGSLVSLDVAGNVTIAGTVSATGNTTFGGSVPVSGNVVVPTNPTIRTHATNKNYVDKRAVAMAVALS